MGGALSENVVVKVSGKREEHASDKKAVVPLLNVMVTG
jgi:hypothetical protein